MKQERRYLFYSVLKFWLACALTSLALLAGTKHRKTRGVAVTIGADIRTIRGQEFLIKLFLLHPTDLKFLIILRRQLSRGKIQQSYPYQKTEDFNFSPFL